MRASCWKNRRKRLFLCRILMAFRSAAAPFKGLCLGRVFLRMARPRLLPGKAEALQQPPQRGWMEGLAKAGFANARKVLASEGGKPALSIGTGILS